MKLTKTLALLTILIWTAGCQVAVKTDYSDKPSPAPKFSHAVSLLKQNKFDQAETSFKQLTQEYPTLAGPHVNLAIIYQQSNRTKEALNLLKKAIALNPKNHDASLQLGLTQRSLGHYTEAKSSYLNGLKHHNNSYSLHLNTAILLDIYMGQLDAALRHYEKAHQINNNSSNKNNQKLDAWISDIRRRIANQQTS